MQQAAEALRADDFDEVAAPVPARRLPSLEAVENVVRPDFARLAPGGHKPQLAAALEAVVQAADTIKAVQDRATSVGAEHRRYVEETTDRIRDLEERLEAERARADAAEVNLLAVTERAAERLEEADLRLAAARDEERLQTERAEAAERRADQGAIDCADRLKDAQDRVFAAETRAIEAREDLVYLENHIRERFGV